jgi:hypothetical protein
MFCPNTQDDRVEQPSLASVKRVRLETTVLSQVYGTNVHTSQNW